MALQKILEAIKCKLYSPPDIILIGEIHTDKTHKQYEAKIIRKFRPEYVLHEALGNNNLEYGKNILEKLKLTTLEECLQQYPLTPSTNKHLMQSLESELLNTPFYEKNTTEILELLFIFSQEKIWIHGTQNNANDLKNLNKYINTVRTIFEMGMKSDNVGVYKEIAKIGSNLCGCDHQKDPINFRKEQNHIDKIDSLQLYISDNNQKREIFMANKIIEYTGKRKTLKPLVAIVGKYHLRKSSLIYSVLKKKNIIFHRRILPPSKDDYSKEAIKYISKIVD